MKNSIREYTVKAETLLKAIILTNGITFTSKAIKKSIKDGAKGQNLIYNMPINSSNTRPQEILIRSVEDNYEVVVSCVAPNSKEPVILDTDITGELIAVYKGEVFGGVDIAYIKTPEYYTKQLSSGENVKDFVSACGLDELNIIPWRGCAISKGCRFCGINSFIGDDVSAQKISSNHNFWEKIKGKYIVNLKEAIQIALKSECYAEHAHVILIAGNLKNDDLNYESLVFSDLAREIQPLVAEKSAEGIVAVLTPPQSFEMIDLLFESGISKVVFNLEAITEEGFHKYCPGKSDLGYQFFIERLQYALKVFGKGNVWTNLVYGLEMESNEDVIEKCSRLIESGIVISANILHLDKGNSLDCEVPSVYHVIDFFFRIEQMNSHQGFLPFYCSKALRTSLSNEVHDMRVLRGIIN